MSTNNYILKLLAIKDPNVEILDKVEKVKNKGVTYTLIFGRLSYQAECCPVCGSIDKKRMIKHGTKTSRIKMLPLNGDPFLLQLKKQCFLCKECGSTFTASTDLVDKYCSISNRVKAHIHSSLTLKMSEKDIAFQHYVSHSTVSKCVDQAFTPYKADPNFLAESLCFDEFKSTKNAKGSMSFIFCDANTHALVDIVENRPLPFLTRYFQAYSPEARKSVKEICIDMYTPYISLIKEPFPKARIVFDSFHMVNHLSRALSKTRIEGMKRFSTYSMAYKRLKRYWKLIQKRFTDLDSTRYSKWTHFTTWKSARDVVEESIAVDKVLKDTYDAYPILLMDLKHQNKEGLKKHLIAFKEVVSTPMLFCINTLLDHFIYVQNSLDTEITNGCLEGINNYIKCIKRIAFGYRSFFHFRNRILICRKLIVPTRKQKAA